MCVPAHLSSGAGEGLCSSVLWTACLVCVSGLTVTQLVISSRTVWVRCVNGDLARRYGLTDRNPAGDYWKKIPGHANCLTGERGSAGDRLGRGASDSHVSVSLQ